MKTSKRVDNLIAFLCVIAVALMLMFTLNSCTRTVYVSGETGDVVQYTKPSSSEFCAMVKLDVTNYEIWWDRNTDVLYWAYDVGYRFGITPIMKADGTCLTYTEWKAKESKK